MPSPNRFVLPGESLVAEFRRRPLALAGVAAAGGLICGALVMGALSAPSKPAESKVAVTSPAKAADAQTEPVPSKPDENKTADNGCANQTWPYIARSCLTEAKPETKPETRGVRVVSTDKLTEPTIGAIEAPGAPKLAEPSAEPSPSVANASPAQNPAEVVAAVKALDYTKTHPVAAAQPAAEPRPTAPQPTAVASTPAPEATPAELAAKPPVAEKPRRGRVAKSAPRKPMELKPQTETVASGSADEDDGGRRVMQSRDSNGRHIVQRWVERDYRGDDGRTQRVIVVPRPVGGGGLFGSIFGGGADSYAARDDD